MGLLRRLAQNGPPAGFNIPSGATGPPAGFTPPPGMTGPPPTQLVATQTGVTIPAGATGPPAGITPPPGMTGPPPGIPPSGGPAGRADPSALVNNHVASVMIGVTTMLIVLCLAVVAGRFLSRRMLKQKLGVDDWTAAASLVLLIGLAIEQYLLAVNAGGTGIPSLASFHILGKLQLVSQLNYNFATNLAKVCILFLYKRVFNLRLKWFRIAWWSCIALVAANSLALLTVNLTPCLPHPPSALWNDRVQCSGFDVASAVILGFINAAIDLTILILPIRMMWKLQMPKKQKMAISSVFGLGLAYVFPAPASFDNTDRLTHAIFKQRGGSLCRTCSQPCCARCLQRRRYPNFYLVNSRAHRCPYLRLSSCHAPALHLHQQSHILHR